MALVNKTTGGFLMALTDKQQDELYWWVKDLWGRVRGPHEPPNVQPNDMLQRADAALYGNNTDGRNNFHWADDQDAGRQQEVLDRLDEIKAALEP
jgi:hypothetical protein